MKNKNGFTLIEVLAAIIILGILLVITVPTFTKYLKGFRIDYYERLEGNINTSGQTFFADNRSYRPIGLLETAIVKLGTLDSKHYIEDVSDYNGDSCDMDSYVIVIKEGKGKYHYETCLKCSKDDYESDKTYCSEAWMKNDNLEYVLEEGPTIYVYQGTPRSELKEKLKIKAWVQKTDGMGNVLATIDGREDETGEVPEIYPDDIDTVNTDVIGEYPVTYTYGSKTTEGKVIVYNNNKPLITIEKEKNGIKTEYDDQNRDHWGQVLHFKFEVINSEEEELFDKSGTKITAVQWYRDETKKWEDFCISVDGKTCVTSTDIEMDTKVKFRFVTSETDYSGIEEKNIRIDRTVPSVGLTETGIEGEDDWFRSNITYGFDKNITKDNPGRLGVMSGIAKYGISTTNPDPDWNFNLTSINDTNVQTEDTHGTTWYVYVEDKAGNRKYVTDIAKKDTVHTYATWDPKPVDSSGNKVEFTPEGNVDVEVTGYCQDDDSGTSSPNTQASIPSPSNGKEVSITCKDKAGNEKKHTVKYYVKYYSVDDSCDCKTYNTCATPGCGKGSKTSTSSCVVPRGQAGCGGCSLVSSTSLGDSYTCTTTTYYNLTCAHSECGCAEHYACWHY